MPRGCPRGTLWLPAKDTYVGGPTAGAPCGSALLCAPSLWNPDPCCQGVTEHRMLRAPSPLPCKITGYTDVAEGHAWWSFAAPSSRLPCPTVLSPSQESLMAPQRATASGSVRQFEWGSYLRKTLQRNSRVRTISAHGLTRGPSVG